jgi:hypothetical protein
VFGGVLISENWNSWGSWDHPYGGASIDSSNQGSPDPQNTLKFLYPAGFPDGNAPDIVTKFFTPQDEIWFQYYFKFSANWKHHSILDKHIYVKYTTNEANIYLGVGWWGSKNMGATVQANNFPNRDFYSNGSFVPTIQWGRWYKVTAHYKMNTVGNNNGIIEIWIKDMVTGEEGITLKYSDVKFRETSAQFTEFKISPIWGGEGDPDKPETDYLWFDKITVSTDSIDSNGDPPPFASNVPMFPSGLKIE